MRCKHTVFTQLFMEIAVGVAIRGPVGSGKTAGQHEELPINLLRPCMDLMLGDIQYENGGLGRSCDRS